MSCVIKEKKTHHIHAGGKKRERKGRCSTPSVWYLGICAVSCAKIQPSLIFQTRFSCFWSKSPTVSLYFPQHVVCRWNWPVSPECVIATLAPSTKTVIICPNSGYDSLMSPCCPVVGLVSPEDCWDGSYLLCHLWWLILNNETSEWTDYRSWTQTMMMFWKNILHINPFISWWDRQQVAGDGEGGGPNNHDDAHENPEEIMKMGVPRLFLFSPSHGADIVYFVLLCVWLFKKCFSRRNQVIQVHENKMSACGLHFRLRTQTSPVMVKDLSLASWRLFQMSSGPPWRSVLGTLHMKKWCLVDSSSTQTP